MFMSQFFKKHHSESLLKSNKNIKSAKDFDDVRYKLMILSAAAGTLGPPAAILGLLLTLVPNPIQPIGPLVMIGGGAATVAGLTGIALTL